MLITITVVLGVISIASLIANILLYIAAMRHMNRADAYEQMYQDTILKIKDRILTTYVSMKQLDDKNIFSKDDEVGQSFAEILNILQELNELTQEDEEIPKEK